MEEERQGTPVYKMLGFAGAGLVVALGVAALVMYAPRLRHESPTERLQATLAQRFPGSEPEVTQTGPDGLRVALRVSFDPTVDAAQAQDVFRRTREVVKAQEIEGVKELEVELRGKGLDGGATTASRSFEVAGDG
ncbi:MAG: hypothetical protein FJX75_18530 [Armatimonadetes bacterium]|nr:hypothetical protein [Armatimonadota bacterium]